MNDLLVEERGRFFVVIINDDEYKIERREANRVATQWGEVEPELVAKIKATLMYAEEVEKTERHMSWNKFADGYGELLDLLSAEQLLSYMVEHLGYNLKHPDKLYKEIQNSVYSKKLHGELIEEYSE